MAMNKYSTFPKAAGLKPLYEMHFIVISRTLVKAEALTFCRDAVGVFYGLKRLGSMPFVDTRLRKIGVRLSFLRNDG